MVLKYGDGLDRVSGLAWPRTVVSEDAPAHRVCGAWRGIGWPAPGPGLFFSLQRVITISATAVLC